MRQIFTDHTQYDIHCTGYYKTETNTQSVIHGMYCLVGETDKQLITEIMI